MIGVFEQIRIVSSLFLFCRDYIGWAGALSGLGHRLSLMAPSKQ